MLENVIEILLSSDFYRDIIPILFINQEFYNNPYLWNKIVNRTYYKSKTLLMMYAINNNLPRSRFLIEAGTNLDLVDSENRSAMIYALAGNAENAPHQCKQCNLAIIEEMCKKQMNLDIIDNDKETAVFYAIRMKHIDALNILCKYNFNVNYKNKDGITALNLAIKLNLFQPAYNLYKKGADINTTDDQFHNLLMAAISAGNHSYEIIEELLKNNINVNQSDHYNCTPLMYAITLKPIEIIELLLSYGADVNMVNTRYQSSLMYAVVKNSIEIIDLLCKYNITSDNYLNSIKCANHLKNYELESYLKKKLKNKKRK